MGFRDRLLSYLIKGANLDTLVELTNLKPPTQTGPSDPSLMANAPIPKEWITNTYAPGMPIRPIAHPGEDEIPREIDYPISVNATIQPRTNYGLYPFSVLQQAYESITEVKMCVHTLGRELTGFQPRLVDGEGKPVLDHPMSWLLESPDKSTPWVVWLTRFLQSVNVFDAGSIFMKQAYGSLQGLHYVDGSTLFVLVNEHGNMPKPDELASNDPVIKARYVDNLRKWLDNPTNAGKPLPKVPAFVQVIKGTPFGWYSQDEIWYRPRFRRYNSPYGMTPMETAWSWILIISNITAFELSHYREGNMPEGLLTAPENWSLAQIEAFEQATNARMSSGPAERNRVRIVPAGFKWQEMKKPQFPKELYETARDNISLSFGIPPSEFGKIPGGGLGGKGFGDMMQNTLFRMGLQPLMEYTEDAFNEILRKFGVDDVEFEMGLPTDVLDPEGHKASVLEQFKAGIITLNDALQELGRDPVPGGNVRLQIANGQVIIIDDYLKPSGTEVVDAVENEHQAQPSIETKDLDNQVANRILDSGSILSGKTISIPKPSTAAEGGVAPETQAVGVTSTSLGKAEGIKHPRTFMGHFAPKARIDQEQARVLGDSMGVNWDEVDLEQFRMGFEEEQEHADTVGDDPKVIGQIALDHLKEMPDYYSRLKEMEEGMAKGCGVTPEDDEYFGAPLAGTFNISFPGSLHANDVQIVAMKPSAATAKPALWKPEGGELEVLMERVGGGQYLREEAAYLLDRALGFFLVPVAYVTEYNGERGAVIFYVKGASPSEDLKEYDPSWVMKAGVLDYIMCQTDRHTGNFLTHPDDPKRPILIDNGLGFPEADYWQWSPFVEAIYDVPITDDIRKSLRVTVKDNAVWKDIAELVGKVAANKARERAKEILANGMIKKPETAVTQEAGS